RYPPPLRQSACPDRPAGVRPTPGACESSSKGSGGMRARGRERSGGWVSENGLIEVGSKKLAPGVPGACVNLAPTDRGGLRSGRAPFIEGPTPLNCHANSHPPCDWLLLVRV